MYKIDLKLTLTKDRDILEDVEIGQTFVESRDAYFTYKLIRKMSNILRPVRIKGVKKYE